MPDLSAYSDLIRLLVILGTFALVGCVAMAAADRANTARTAEAEARAEFARAAMVARNRAGYARLGASSNR